MAAFDSFNEIRLEPIARMLGQEVTGTELSNIFDACRISDSSGESTKWRRIYSTLLAKQQQDRCGNAVAALIMAIMSPARFIGAKDHFEQVRRQLNAVLMFDSLELTPAAQFQKVVAAQTISEAEQRAQLLIGKFQGRRIHRETTRFCQAELLQENYFHAVFEAVKGLMQRVRDLTGLESDGCTLVDEAFAIGNPLLVLNSLGTETEKSEHKGFAMLLKGCFSAVRTPRAHEPRILWHDDENEAADCLTLVSLLHFRLDDAIRVPRPGTGQGTVPDKEP